MRTSSSRTLRLLVYLVLLIQVVVILYTLLQRPEPGLGMVVRVAALFGYTALFWAILASEYMREMRKLFGRPFLKVHHSLVVIGWVLILIHPVTVALWSNSFAVLVPIFSPFQEFLLWAGRPALYLFGIATLAGLVRRRIKGWWKQIHWLNYLAFSLVFIHSSLIGTDLGSGWLRIIWAAMFGIVLYVFVRKRLGGR
jgi:sulfoxide reductase heme-binding subunit YedZ